MKEDDKVQKPRVKTVQTVQALDQPIIFHDSRSKDHMKPRIKFRRYSLRFLEKNEETGKLVTIKKNFKYLKEARKVGMKHFRAGNFISLYNIGGIPMCL